MGDSTPPRGGRRLLAIAPAIGLLALAACGGDGLQQEEATTTTRAATTTTSAPPASTPTGEPDLKQVQEQLNALGCDAGTPDGAAGAQTTAAITRFQAAAGLEQDGVLGPATQQKLAEAASAGTPRCGGSPTATTTPAPTGATTTTTGGAGPSPP
jgi:peptidoglycan hydrolase-like protein with peptidoglycan-binding domain